MRFFPLSYISLAPYDQLTHLNFEKTERIRTGKTSKLYIRSPPKVSC